MLSVHLHTFCPGLNETMSEATYFSDSGHGIGPTPSRFRSLPPQAIYIYIYIEFHLHYVFLCLCEMLRNRDPIIWRRQRTIYSIVIVWLHIILLLQKLLPPWYLLNTGGFIIAASALIKVSRLDGLYRHLYTQLIYWHYAVCYTVYPSEFIE